MSVQFKAYLLKDNGKNIEEIRNFRVDEGAASSYEYLRKKISTIFPNLGWDEDGSSLKLLWKDSAGDFITFSSDEELVDALGEAGPDSIFRVYIKRVKEEEDFSWQTYVEKMLRSLNNERPYSRPQADFSPFHPYARCRPTTPGCRPKPGCCPGGRTRPRGFPFGPDQSPFPGLFAGIWAFQGGNDEQPCGGTPCAKQQRQSEKQSSKDEGPSCSKQSKEQESATS